MKIPMVSIAGHVYAGRRLKPGDAFDARGAGDAKLLVALGRAERAAPVVPAIEKAPEAPVVKAPRVYRTAAIYAQPVATQEPAEVAETPAVEAPAEVAAEPAEPVRTKRVYRRRDLKAEGSEE